LTRALRLVGVLFVLMPVLIACGKTTSSGGALSVTTLYSSRLTLGDVSPFLPDAKNWWVAAPTFDVRPLNSATRADADLGGLTIRFSHLGTGEILSLNYQVLSSNTVASALMRANKIISGNGQTGPKAGDQVLYYNKKLQAGPTVYNNLAFVQVGDVIITIVWSHVDGFASTSSVGKFASKAVARLKDGLAGKASPSPAQAADPLLLAPPGPQLTLLGSTRLPIEVLAQMIDIATPTGLADEFHHNGVTDFVFGDYALNIDTRMEVQTAGIMFSKFPTGGSDFIKGYFGASNLSSTGEAGGYDTATGQYVFGFGSGSRAILMICKSSADGEEAARACEEPMALVVAGWHSLLGTG